MKYLKATIKQIRDSRRLLENQYAHQDSDGGFNAIVAIQQLKESDLPAHPYVSLALLDDSDTNISREAEGFTYKFVKSQEPNFKEDKYAWIERFAHELHLKLWKQRNQIFPEGSPIDIFKLLEPSIGIKLIGYTYDEANYLGTSDSNGLNKEIAGMINTKEKIIGVSRKLRNKEISRFTLAHELGHALLHSDVITMHRDRPMDGSFSTKIPRPAMEIEADKFAVYYLMPEKLVRKHFQQIFGVELFFLTDDTAFALVQFNADNLIVKCKTPRDLARVLAKSEQYNGCYMESLASRFGVSDGAMAIRIEELGLIKI